tara:strand:+ start:754 stop:966 length:213 start_codon:yes stop_codon:yes gene_type:complete
MKIDRTVQEVELTIEFHYVPYNPGDYNNPPEGGYVSIEDVTHKGESIYELINYSIVEQLEDEIYEELSEQ